jgi:hypothetical protein
MKTKTNVKAAQGNSGGDVSLMSNHNETPATGLRVKTAVQVGLLPAVQ